MLQIFAAIIDVFVNAFCAARLFVQIAEGFVSAHRQKEFEQSENVCRAIAERRCRHEHDFACFSAFAVAANLPERFVSLRAFAAEPMRFVDDEHRIFVFGPVGCVNDVFDFIQFPARESFPAAAREAEFLQILIPRGNEPRRRDDDPARAVGVHARQNAPDDGFSQPDDVCDDHAAVPPQNRVCLPNRVCLIAKRRVAARPSVGFFGSFDNFACAPRFVAFPRVEKEAHEAQIRFVRRNVGRAAFHGFDDAARVVRRRRQSRRFFPKCVKVILRLPVMHIEHLDVQFVPSGESFARKIAASRDPRFREQRVRRVEQIQFCVIRLGCFADFHASALQHFAKIPCAFLKYRRIRDRRFRRQAQFRQKTLQDVFARQSLVRLRIRFRDLPDSVLCAHSDEHLDFQCGVPAHRLKNLVEAGKVEKSDEHFQL